MKNFDLHSDDPLTLLAFHREFLKNWLAQKNSSLSFEELWKIREACIEKLGA